MFFSFPPYLYFTSFLPRDLKHRFLPKLSYIPFPQTTILSLSFRHRGNAHWWDNPLENNQVDEAYTWPQAIWEANSMPGYAKRALWHLGSVNSSLCWEDSTRQPEWIYLKCGDHWYHIYPGNWWFVFFCLLHPTPYMQELCTVNLYICQISTVFFP